MSKRLKLMAVLIAMVHLGCSSGSDRNLVSTVTCHEGQFRATVRERGVVTALREITIKSPASRHIARMISEGTIVEKGDLLFQLDPSGLEQQIKDREADLAIVLAMVERRKASADAELHYGEQEVASARMALELAKKELENARAGLLIADAEKITAASDVKRAEIDVEDETRKLGISKQLKEAGLEEQREHDVRVMERKIAEVDKRKAIVIRDDVMNGLTDDEILEYELEVELAALRLASAEKNLKEGKERNELWLARAQRRVDYAKKSLERAEKDFADTFVRSSARGVVLIKSTSGGKYAAGMWAFKNREIMSIPDLSQMKVNSFVEESMAARIKKGQKALIQVAGVPDKVFNGRVLKVGALPKTVSDELDSASQMLVSRPDRRVFEVEIAINEEDHRLKPGMKAEVDIITATVPKAITVPRNAIFEENGKYHVSVLTPDGPEQREVKIAMEGEYTTAVTEGLEDGCEVILRGE